MLSLFDHATDLLGLVIENAEGRSYTYVRSTGNTVIVTATRSRSYKQMFTSDGAVVEFEVYDFLMDQANLESACGDFVEPRPGDLIKDTETGRLYEVLRDPADTCWRFCDSNSRRIRVHTKQREVDGQPADYPGDEL